MVLGEVRSYFADYGSRQPPFPEDVLLLAPCGFLITEWERDDRERIGRIEISKPDGRIIYDKAWLLDRGGEVDLSTLVNQGDGTEPRLFGDQAITPRPLRAPPRGPRVFNESVSESLEARDSADATVDRPTTTGDVTVPLTGVSATGIAGNVSITEENDRVAATGNVIDPIWNIGGPDAIFRIDQAQKELVAVRVFLVGLRAQQSTGLMGHNNPPDSVEPPDVDVEVLDAAIQALKVLRPLLSQPQPDFEVVRLIWSALLSALRTIARVIAWAGRLTKAAFNTVLNSAFGKAFQATAGAMVAKETIPPLITVIKEHGPEGVQNLIDFLKTVAAAHGVHF